MAGVGIWDLVFPKRCVACKKFGEYVCADCFATISYDVRLICVVCNRGSINGLTHTQCIGRYRIDGAFCGVVYGRVVRKLIYSFKYQPFVSDLRKLMTELFCEGIIQQEVLGGILEQYRPFLTPIPLSRAKLRMRGYNQSEILAQGLGKKLGLEMEDFLLRTKETVPQFGLQREERRENIRNAFVLKSETRLPENVILVDDVLTSGSTLGEAARVLKRAGVKRVWGLSFAREP